MAPSHGCLKFTALYGNYSWHCQVTLYRRGTHYKPSETGLHAIFSLSVHSRGIRYGWYYQFIQYFARSGSSLEVWKCPDASRFLVGSLESYNLVIEIVFKIFITKATLLDNHYDVIKWKHLPRCCPFMRGIYRSPRCRWLETRHQSMKSTIWKQLISNNGK